MASVTGKMKIERKPSSHLLCLEVAGIIHRSKASMANFTQVIKESLWVIPFKQVGHLRISEAPRPRECGHH